MLDPTSPRFASPHASQDEPARGDTPHLPTENGTPEDYRRLYALYQAECHARLKAEQRLEQADAARQMLDALMDYVPEGITIAEAPDVHIVRVSRFGQAITGRDRSVLEGIPVEEHAARWGIFESDGVTPGRNEELPLARATQRGEVVTDEEWVFKRPSGEMVTILCNAGPIRNEAGEITGGVSVWRDISEQKRQRERLHVLASARCLLWYGDVEEIGTELLRWRLRFPSEEAANRFFPLNPLPGETFAAAWYRSRLPEDRVRTDQYGNSHVRSGESYSQEYRCQAIDGSVRWMREDVHVEVVEPGKRWRAVGVCVDVTEHKQIEEELARLAQALERERAYLQAVLAQIPSGLSIAEAPSGRLMLHNDAAIRLIRHPLLTSESTGGYAQYGALHPDGTPYEPEKYPIARALTGETVVQHEMNYRRGDGTETVFSVNAAPMRDEAGHIIAAISTFEDIAPRKQAEEERRYILSSARCLLWQAEVSANADGQYTLWETQFPDPEAAHNFMPIARQPGVPFYRAWYRARLPEDTERCNAIAAVALKAGRDYAQEFRVRLADGMLRWMHENVRVQVLEEGRRWRLVGVCTDITERTLMEKALKESEEQFRQLADAVPVFVWMCSPDGVTRYFNRRWFEYTGISEAEAYTLEGFTLPMHPDDVPMASERWLHAVSTGEPYEVEYRLRDHATGQYRWFIGRGQPVSDRNGNIVRWFGTSTDVDDYKRAHAEIESLNERLRRAMAETHHRVKNNLQTISGMVELQLPEKEDMVPVDSLKRIGQHVGSLAGLHDLLTQEAHAQGDAHTVSAQDVLEKLLPLVNGLLVERDLVWQVEDVRLMLRQASGLSIFVNEAVSNAVKHGGTRVELSLRVVDGQARLEVRDNGPGFPTAFDASRDANTGLGLMESVARFDLLGEISFGSAPEGGASIVVTFPLAGEV